MGFLVWGIVCGFETRNFIWEFQCCLWYIVSQPEMLHFQSMQPRRQDVKVEFQSNSALRWIMSYVSKPTNRDVIIKSLRLICYIQCGFDISYLSIPGIAANDRCNMSHVFTFSFQLSCGDAYIMIILIFFFSILNVNACVSVSCPLIFFLCYRIKNNSAILCQLF